MTTSSTIHEAIASAEAQALADHNAGTCHQSEWSCSFCEAVDQSDPRRTVSGMTMTIEATSSGLRGDICPEWCGGKHLDLRGIENGRPVHPDDAHREHQSCIVDSWTPADGWRPLTVLVRGQRYDNHHDDGSDAIVVSDIYGHGDLTLEPSVARRLAEAMLLACDLADGVKPAGVL